MLYWEQVKKESLKRAENKLERTKTAQAYEI
jgi:hypothetical protein